MKKRTLVSVVFLVLLLPSCQVGRMILYNFANITDYKIFPSRPLTPKGEPFRFHEATGLLPHFIGKYGGAIQSDSDFLEKHKTVAFLVIRNDSLLYERYFNNYKQDDIVASFSMAKSVTSILIGCAIDDGLIKSVEEPIINYIPELKDNGLGKVTIKHLLLMTSGIDFNESYANPFGDAASFYYGRDLRRVLYKMEPETEPGKYFEYISGNTQLLGLILTNALKGKSVTEYFQEKIWSKLGMEYDASWSLDSEKEGLEKTFCCINARARDFAKLGRLYLNKGNWNGEQIVSEKWVEESTKLDTANGSAPYYQYQWWIPNKDGAFMAEGILGQFIYVYPKKNLIIVRLGKKHAKVNWWQFFNELSQAY